MTHSLIETRVLPALRGVDDPELGINIVDLGLVAAIDVEDEIVRVRLLMTSPTCPSGGQIAAAAVEAIACFVGPFWDIKVSIDPEADWSPELAAPHVREQFRQPASRLGDWLLASFKKLRGAA